MAALPPADSSLTHIWVTTASTAASVTHVITFTVPALATTWTPEEDVPEELRRRALLRWTLAAIQVAQERLRSSQEDPAGVLSYRPRREPSRRLHDRPRVKGRVCSGSSRYRVFRA